MKNKLSI